LLISWTVGSGDVRAERIVLNSGEVIDGSIVDATRNTVVVRRSIGGMRQMRIEDIAEVRLDLAQGQPIAGQFLSWADGVYEVRAGDEVIRVSEGGILSREPRQETAGQPARTPPARAPGEQQITAAPAPSIAAAGRPAAPPQREEGGTRAAAEVGREAPAESSARDTRAAAVARTSDAPEGEGRPAAAGPSSEARETESQTAAAAPSSEARESERQAAAVARTSAAPEGEGGPAAAGPSSEAREIESQTAAAAPSSEARESESRSAVATRSAEARSRERQSAAAAASAATGDAERQAGAAEAAAAADAESKAVAADAQTRAAGDADRQAGTDASRTARAGDASAAVGEQANLAVGEQAALAVKASVDPSEPSERSLVFKIELSQPADQPVVLIYGTVDGTAKAGEDYEAKQGMVTLAPGDQSAEVRVPLLKSQPEEGEKRFELVLMADPKVAEVVDRRVIATIKGAD
jgi:hypothetical protein